MKSQVEYRTKQITKANRRRRPSVSGNAGGKLREDAGRPTQSDRRRESMTLILDHAEALFAERGFNGATLKEVADEAGVDPALMRYYFGDKQQLFQAVFTRRAPIINELNQKRMADYRAAAGKNLQLEGIIEAFIGPAFEKMASDQGWRNYMAIVAYVNASRGFLHKLMSESFDHVSHQLIADMRTIFPNATEEELYWSYQFLTGAYTFSLGRTGRIDALSKGLVSSSNVLAIANRLPVFLANGIRGLLAREGNGAPGSSANVGRKKDK